MFGTPLLSMGQLSHFHMAVPGFKGGGVREDKYSKHKYFPSMLVF